MEKFIYYIASALILMVISLPGKDLDASENKSKPLNPLFDRAAIAAAADLADYASWIDTLVTEPWCSLDYGFSGVILGKTAFFTDHSYLGAYVPVERGVQTWRWGFSEHHLAVGRCFLPSSEAQIWSKVLLSVRDLANSENGL